MILWFFCTLKVKIFMQHSTWIHKYGWKHSMLHFPHWYLTVPLFLLSSSSCVFRRSCSKEPASSLNKPTSSQFLRNRVGVGVWSAHTQHDKQEALNAMSLTEKKYIVKHKIRMISIHLTFNLKHVTYKNSLYTFFKFIGYYVCNSLFISSESVNIESPWHHYRDCSP